MIKNFIFSVLIVVPFCTDTNDLTKKAEDCIDLDKVKNNPCTMIYSPVCGCDGKTYGNSCDAENSGLKSWTEGACEDRN